MTERTVTAPLVLPKQILDQAVNSPDINARRDAFLRILTSADWRQALAPHVISRQGTQTTEGHPPDWLVFRRAACHIAADPDKVNRALELAGVRHSGALLTSLAGEMKKALVEPAIAQLAGAEGPRAALLQRILYEADPAWVSHPLAIPIIRRDLSSRDGNRSILLQWLASAGILENYQEELTRALPKTVEEWAAIGKARLNNPTLYHYAMTTINRNHATVHYLLQLNPLPKEVPLRILSAAQPDWLAALFESVIVHPLESPWLLPLAEVAVQTSSRAMAVSNAWIGASKLGRELLDRLSSRLHKGRTATDVGRGLWTGYKPPSANRALEQGRQGKEPELRDAAALVRQLEGQDLRDLIREILERPLLQLRESVLHPLVAVKPQAARFVLDLCHDSDAAVAAAATSVTAWTDVEWTDLEETVAEEVSEDRTDRILA